MDVKNEIISEIKTIISDISRRQVSEIKMTDKFVDDLGFSSLDFADLLNQTELIIPINFPADSPTIPYKSMTVDDFQTLFIKLINDAV